MDRSKFAEIQKRFTHKHYKRWAAFSCRKQ